MEGTDVRQLVPNQFPQQFQFVVGDLSFISLTKVLSTIHTLMSQGGTALLLVKPQFEVGVGGTKKGIVRDKEKRKEVLQRIERDATQLGFVFLGGIESPVQGGSGNVEYLIHLRA
jgi:23S rRNA (cytidine1920-2'-O)/16S rRNA (cytidine1409-2'-O)-methyltransferase